MNITEDIYQASNLTMDQLLFWTGQRIEPGNAMFQMGSLCTIEGPIELSHLRVAFQAVLDSSDALRTVIEERRGVPYQRVLDEVHYELDYVDFSGQLDPRGAAFGWAGERCRRPLDLKSRMFDSVLLKMSEYEYEWYLCLHHLICDGWSFSIATERLAAAYDLSRKGRLAEFFGDYPRFAEYLEFERAYHRSARYGEAEAYWKKKFSVVGEQPRFYGSVAQITTTEVARVSRELPEASVEALAMMASKPELLAVSANSGIASIFLAIALAFLYRITGSRRITVGLAIQNRRSKKFKETIGLFVHFLPLQISIDDDDTFLSLAAKVRDEIHASARYASYSVPNSVQNRIYDVVFNYIVASHGDFNGARARTHWIHSGSGGEAIGIHLEDISRSGKLVINLDLHHDVFDEDQRSHAADTFFNMIEAFLRDAEGIVTRPDLLAPEAPNQVSEFLEEELAFDFTL
jgi:hypothetical protein